MKCSYCDSEYPDPNQTICEYCGSELIKNTESIASKPGSKINQFLNESGLKDLYQKFKKSLKE